MKNIRCRFLRYSFAVLTLCGTAQVNAQAITPSTSSATPWNEFRWAGRTLKITHEGVRRSCMKAQVIRAFIDAVGQAGDMDTIRDRFVELFGPDTTIRSPSRTSSDCWTLGIFATFDHPLRAITLSLNEEMLENDKGQLKPEVQAKNCVSGSTVTENLERLEKKLALNEPRLTRSLFKLTSPTFTKLIVHELDDCLIHIEFVAS